MEEASASHLGMAPWVATLATLVVIYRSSATRSSKNPKTTGHDNKGKRKPQTHDFEPQKKQVKPLR